MTDITLKSARRAALAALALSLLAGCGSSGVQTWQPIEAEARKTNEVEFNRLNHVVHFPSGVAALTPSENERLASFLDEADVFYGDKVFLTAAPADGLSQKRQSAIRRVLAKRGIMLSAVAVAAGAGGARDELTLAIERYTVTPPKCPDWSKPAGSDPTNSVSSNFGCATATNLGLMVASPRDLLVGRQPGPADADPAVKAIQNYRAHKPIVLPDDLSSNSSPGSSGGAAGGAGGAAGGGGAATQNASGG